MLENIKTKLTIEHNRYDAVLQGIIDGVVAQVEGYCDRKFLRGTHTEYFSNVPVYMSATPIASVTSIGVKTGVNTYEDQTLSEIDYDSDTGEIELYFNSGLKRLKVVYVGGYFASDDHEDYEDGDPLLPADLRELIERLAIRYYKRLPDEGKKSVVFDKTTTTFGKIMQDEDKALLDNNYRATFI